MPLIGTWLDFVCAHRSGRDWGEGFDIAQGPVADDDVYATVRLYEAGFLNKEAAIDALKIKRLYGQVLFRTEESLRFLKFAESWRMDDGGK